MSREAGEGTLFLQFWLTAPLAPLELVSLFPNPPARGAPGGRRFIAFRLQSVSVSFQARCFRQQWVISLVLGPQARRPPGPPTRPAVLGSRTRRFPHPFQADVQCVTRRRGAWSGARRMSALPAQPWRLPRVAAAGDRGVPRLGLRPCPPAIHAEGSAPPPHPQGEGGAASRLRRLQQGRRRRRMS